MWRDSMARRFISSTCVLTLLLQTSGCTSWSAQKNPPAQVLAEKPIDHVRVIRNDGSRMDVYRPTVANDSLTGFAQKPSAKREARAVGIPLADVRYLEVQKTSTGKTVLLVAGIGVTALIIVAASSDWYSFNWGGGNDTTTNSSCPVIYSWDGKDWRLDSGTYGGAVMPALQRADIDNLEYAVAERGILRLRLANELREVEYVDALSILAADHPTGVSVLPDAGNGEALYTVSRPIAPLDARDDAGRNVLSRVAARDGIAWESSLRVRDPAVPTDLRDGVNLVFRRQADRDSVKLVLGVQNTPWAAHLMLRLAVAWGRDIRQWYDPATTDSVARAMAPVIYREAALQVQVRVNGVWETRGRVWEVGPELAKQVVVPLDLGGVSGDKVEVRLESIPNLWWVDYAAMDGSAPTALAIHSLPLTQARLSGGWDALALLAAEDHKYLVLEHGAVSELSVRVPAVPAGMARSYLARTTGWYRIDAAESAEPDFALLGRLSREGASRIAVGLANQALGRLQ